MTYCDEKGLRIERHAGEENMRVLKGHYQVSFIPLRTWIHGTDEEIIEVIESNYDAAPKTRNTEMVA